MARTREWKHPEPFSGGDLPDGWLTPQEATTLARMAKDKLVLEIGAYLGRSTVAMARTAKLVVSIDHHGGSPEHQPGMSHHDPRVQQGKGINTLGMFLHNLKVHGVREKVIPIIGDSRTIKDLGFLQVWHFDMAFIDGNHELVSVLNDGALAFSRVKMNHPVVFHDFGWPGVAMAVAEFTRNGRVATKLVGDMVQVKV